MPAAVGGALSIAAWNTSASAVAVVLAFGVSAAAGPAFGIYPALRTARLQPVDAVLIRGM